METHRIKIRGKKMMKEEKMKKETDGNTIIIATSQISYSLGIVVLDCMDGTETKKYIFGIWM